MAKMKQRTKKQDSFYIDEMMEQLGLIRKLARRPKRKEKLLSENSPEAKKETCTIQQIAEELKVGSYKFFRFLREKGILLEDNWPAQSYVKDGYLTLENKFYSFSNGYGTFRPMARVTKKGALFLKKTYREADK